MHIGLEKDVSHFSSDDGNNAVKDLEALGYDVAALLRRQMNDCQIVELRDKAYRYRGIPIPIHAPKDTVREIK